MKRKVYASISERYADRRRGAVIFLVANGLVLLLYLFLQAQLKQAAPDIYFEDQERYARYIQLIPWVANGLLLLPALVWRPELAVGYFACIGLIIISIAGLAGLFFVSCVVSIVFWVFPPLGLIVFFVLFMIGLGWGIQRILEWASDWLDLNQH